MYLWDANILRHFGQGQATLHLYLLRVPWAEIALPSVVVAEVLRGRCEFALKAPPAEAPLAHQRLLDTQQMLTQFHIAVFDAAGATVMARLRQQHRRRRRYADLWKYPRRTYMQYMTDACSQTVAPILRPSGVPCAGMVAGGAFVGQERDVTPMWTALNHVRLSWCFW